MAIEILSAGSGAARSTDVVVAAGSSATLFLKSAAGGTLSDFPTPCVALVQLKDSAGNYNTIGKLTASDPAVSIVSPGTYSVQRQNTGASFGVEQG